MKYNKVVDKEVGDVEKRDCLNNDKLTSEIPQNNVKMTVIRFEYKCDDTIIHCQLFMEA